MLTIILFCVVFTFTNALNQLSFSGGGAFGAVEIGILKRIHQQSYDLYTGVSAGALNAGLLSYFDNLWLGIKTAETIYTDMKTRMVYELLPNTGISLLNTAPLHKTLSSIIDNMEGIPVIPTLIGTTNMYSGNLDVYDFQEEEDKVNLLMASSAIPVAFPPIKFNGDLYADGGTLSNELLLVNTAADYLNITYITPHEGYVYDDSPITSTKEMAERTLKIIYTNFNNPLATLNQDCSKPRGEINKYYVDSQLLKGYSMLDFDKGAELIQIGYNNVETKKYKIC